MKPVRFKIVVTYRGQSFHVADLSINALKGELYYFQSGSSIVGVTELVPAGTKVHHISFHKDGKSHAKDTFGRKHVAVQFLPIKDIGYQILLVESVSNVLELPETQANEEADCILKLPDDLAAGIRLTISLISGHLITGGRAKARSVGEGGLLATSTHALGHESGNADKLIQFALESCEPSPPDTNRRRVEIPPPADIHRDNGEPLNYQHPFAGMALGRIVG